MWIFLALLIVPMIEIALFIQIGGLIGLWPTLGLVVLSAIIGTFILRVQGARALMDLRQTLGTLSDPTAPLAHGAMILMAGIFLLTPGFFTDALGLLLLVPGVRNGVIVRLRQRIVVHASKFAAQRAQSGPQTGPRDGRPDDRVIDGDFTDLSDSGPKRPTHPPSGWTKH